MSADAHHTATLEISELCRLRESLRYVRDRILEAAKRGPVAADQIGPLLLALGRIGGDLGDVDAETPAVEQLLGRWV